MGHIPERGRGELCSFFAGVTADGIATELIVGLIAALVGSILGNVIYRPLRERWELARYGGWVFIVNMPDGREGLRRRMSVAQVREYIPHGQNDRDVDEAGFASYITGVVSKAGPRSICWINGDPLTLPGLLTIQREERRVVIDLAKNPRDESPDRGGG